MRRCRTVDAVQFSDLTIHRMVSYKNQDLERETERCMMIQFHARSSQTKQLPVLSGVRDVGARFLVLRRRSARQLDFRAGAAISMRKIAADGTFSPAWMAWKDMESGYDGNMMAWKIFWVWILGTCACRDHFVLP